MTSQEKFGDEAANIAKELADHFNLKARELGDKFQNPGLLGASYSIFATYLLTHCVAILSENKKSDKEIYATLEQICTQAIQLSKIIPYPTEH